MEKVAKNIAMVALVVRNGKQYTAITVSAAREIVRKKGFWYAPFGFPLLVVPDNFITSAEEFKEAMGCGRIVPTK